MSDLEDRRREAPDGPEDTEEMRQDVNINRLLIPTSTKWALNIASALLVLIAAWGGSNIELIRRDMNEQNKAQAAQNAAILIEIAGIKASVAINSAGIAGLESRTEKLEGSRR